MVDQERVDRLLARVADDLRELAGYRRRGAELLNDRTELAAAKYYFITAIEGCARVAQHLIAAEGWLVAESNADAVRRLGSQGVLDMSTAESVATAVGFRNILVHEYAEVDNQRVVNNLDRLSDLDAFVSSVAAWLSEHP